MPERGDDGIEEPLDTDIEAPLEDEAPVDPALSEEARFLVRADRVATRLAEQLDALDVHYARLKSEAWTLVDFMTLSEPLARRVLDLDRRLPVPPTACLGEEAALLCALQAAANAVLQIAPEGAGPDRELQLHHASFQRSLAKSRQHLADYHGYRARTGGTPSV